MRYAFYSKLVLLAGVAAAGLCPSVAAAQEGAPAPDSGYGSGEIVVTANKREENLRDVGMSITAYSGAVLEERRITDLADLTQAVPGLVYAPSSNDTPILTIRGIGFNESSLGVYPAVSAYIDQAPLPFPVMGMHSAYDLQRVEVLKGPQGTLFGQNSTGGAINFIANKPTDSLEAGFNVGYGRFNLMEANGFISGPIGETVGARLAFTAMKSDDWQRSSSRPDDTNGEQEYYAGRMILEFKPSDTVNLSLNVNAWRDRSEPQAAQLIAVRPKRTNVPNTSKVTALPLSEEKLRTADWTEQFSPEGDRKFFQAALRADFDVSSDLTVTSITNYIDFSQDKVVDFDGTFLRMGDASPAKGNVETFTQELRIANSADNALRWLLGANYESSKTYEYQDGYFGDITNSNPGSLNFQQLAAELKQDIESYALFGSIEYDITEQLTFKASARYTSTENDSQNCIIGTGNGAVSNLFNILGGLLGTESFEPLVPGDGRCTALNNITFTPGEPYIDTLDEDNVSWRVGLDYKPTDNTLLYASVARGYKAGSYPAVPAGSTWNQMLAVTQEKVTAYEAGFKTSLLDRRIDLDVAGFYYDYRDKQVRGKLDDLVFRALENLVNVPKSRIYGAEASLRVRPMAGLTLGVDGTYLDSRVQKYTGFNVLGIVNDFTGDPLPSTPKWTYSFSADYRQPVGDGSLFMGATYHGQSKSDAVFGGGRIGIEDTAFNMTLVDRPFIIEDYALLDLRAGYETDRWKVQLWGKNVTNKYHYTTVIAGSDTVSRLTGRPVTYGVTVGFKFD